MTDDKPIKTVEAPVLVVESKEPTPPALKQADAPPTVLDTQEIRKRVLRVMAEENKKSKKVAIDKQKSPPYLFVILLMALLGFLTVIVVLTLRQDLDFIIVSGGVFLLATGVINTIFQIMKSNLALDAQREANITQQLILQEAHEANVKAELALKATKETHGLVNSQWEEFKREEKQKKLDESAAYEKGRKDANDRTDSLPVK